MKKILQFLASEGSFVYEDRGFRLVDSEYSPAFGGDSVIVLAGEVLEIRFLLDHGQLFMDFRGKGRNSPYAWFSIDIVRQLLSAEIGRSIVDTENIAFVRQSFDDLQSLFNKERLNATETACKKLKKERAKRLFG